MNFAAIIVAAGSGRRMGFDKLLAPLAGKPVLQHSIEAFLATPGLSQLIVVTDEVRFASCLPDEPTIEVQRLDGGAERHFSVAEGLKLVAPGTDLIAVHDGARPLIRPQQITRCLEAAASQQAAASARRITETVKRADDSDKVAAAVDRTNLWAMETPQAFDAQLLQQAYAKVLAEDLLVTDEVSAVEHLGIATTLVENTTPNLKITYPQDLPLAAHLLDFQA